MYAKCGSMLDARLIFDSLPSNDLVCWNALISGYADNGEADTALECFQLMRDTTCLKPNARTFVATLKACTVLAERQEHKSEALTRAVAIHRTIGMEPDVYVANTLVTMYAKSGYLDQARQLFDGMKDRDIVSWNAMIQGYAENGEGEMALKLFSNMRQRSCEPDARTFVAALKACCGFSGKEIGQVVAGRTVKMETLERGYMIHSQAVQNSCGSHLYVSCALINMYSHCGSLVDARATFDRMKEHDVVSWNSLITGYVDNGEECGALKLFRCMRSRSFLPNELTFSSVLNACSSLAIAEEGQLVDGRLVKVESLRTGRAIHNEAGSEIRDGCVIRALVNMYGKCGSLQEAWRVMDRLCLQDDPASWTTLMLAYADNVEGDLALDIFSTMQRENVPIDDRALVAATKACTSLAVREEGTKVEQKVVKLTSLRKGMDVHSSAWERNSELSIFVGNSLLDMYAKCRSLLDARKVFDAMQWHTLVSWNSLILAYVENDTAELALNLFNSLPLQPDTLTFVAALKACSVLAVKEAVKPVDGKLVKLDSLQRCMLVHARLGSISKIDVMCGNTLVDVYSKCGSLFDARVVFDKMASHSLVSWNVLMQACVENSEAELALKLFSCLRQSLFHAPDGHSFTQALKASAAVVSVEYGRAIHAELCRCGTEVDEVVVASLMDVYGKCGNMTAAQVVFDSVPRHDSVCWTAVIAGYSLQGDGHRVLELFHRMHTEGFEADEITYVCVLAACSHAGLLEKCNDYFHQLSKHGSLAVGLEHLTCLVDGLGRINKLDAAVHMVENAPVKPSSVTWRALLAACCKWRNASVGKLAFEKLISLDEDDISAYVLMRNILCDDKDVRTSIGKHSNEAKRKS